MGLSLRGTTSGAIDINAPAVAGDNTITLPGNNGSANQFFKNSGTAGIVTYSSMVETTTGVGIGTANPQKTLHVNSTSADSFGIVRISGRNRGGQLEFCTDATKTAGIYSPTSSNKLVFFTSSSETERLRIDSEGGHRIKCSESYTAASLAECNTTQLALNINQTRQGQTKGIAIGAIGSSGGSTGIQAYDTSNDSANPLLINPFGGKIGIGTDDPGSTQLKIETGSGTRAISLNAPTNGTYITFETAGTAYADIGAEKGVVGSGSADTPVINARGSRDLAFRTNSNERLRITSGGDVGIGDNNPDSSYGTNLSIYDSGTDGARIKLCDSTSGKGSNDGFDLIDVGGTAYLINRDPGALVFYTSNTERVRIDSSGNVEVHNSSSSLLSRISAHGFTCRDNWGGASGLGNGMSSPATNTLAFTTNSTERVRIDSNGKFLVGTEAGRSAGDVNGQLQVEGTNLHTASMNLISNAGASTDNNVHLSLCKSRGTSDGSNTIVASGDNLGTIQWCGADGTDLNSVAAMIQGFVDNTPGSNDMPGRLSFWTTEDGAAVPYERMRIDSKGRLLVSAGTITAGTVQPGTVWSKGADNLMISEGTGSGYTEGAFKGVSPSDYRGGGIFMYNANSGGTSNQWFAGRPYANSDQYIIARSTGVSVSDQSTAQTTHQLFSVYSSGNAVLQGTLTQSGSDDKLKKNRTPLASALDKVKTLEGFTYNWNDDAINNYGFRSDEGLLVGMSAQELQAVLPEAVKTVTKNKEVSDPSNGEAGEKIEYLTIQYDRVVPLLVEAIKELSAKVAALEGS